MGRAEKGGAQCRVVFVAAARITSFASVFFADGQPEVVFDLPLKLGKKCCSITDWALCTWFLGSLLLFVGLSWAYSSSGVAVAGHHALVNGLLMWVLDFLKEVVQTSLYRHFCGSSDRYEPLITELKHPLPEVPEVYQESSGQDAAAEPCTNEKGLTPNP